MCQELAERVAAIATSDGLHGTHLERLSIHRRTVPTALGLRVLTPGLGVILGGNKLFARGGQSLDCGAAEWIVTPTPIATTCAVTRASTNEPYLALIVQLDARAVADAAVDVEDDRGPSEDGASETPLRGSRLDDTLSDVLLRLVRSLDSPRDAKLVGPLVERELIYRLLQSDQRSLVRRIALGDRAVLEVIGLIESRYALRHTVRDLARTVHLGVSSLHHRFKAATGISPLQYLKRVRLREARRLMLEDRFDAASAAYSVGYASASQFSRDYRKVYGLPPRRDLARLAAS